MTSTNSSKVSPNSIIQDLQNQDIKVKIKAVKNLPDLIRSLSVDKIKNQFIPFFISCINVEDDELLAEVNKIFQPTVNSIGGSKNIKYFVPIIEVLLNSIDPSVRNEIITTCKYFLDNQEEFKADESHYYSLLNKTFNCEDIMHRIGFIDFSAEFFGFYNDKNKTQIINNYKIILGESTSTYQLLKLELAIKMTNLAQTMPRKDFIEIYTKLFKEKYDNIRFNLVKALACIKGLKNISHYNSFLANAISEIGDDESWRVRLTLAQEIPKILELPLIEKNECDIKLIILKVYAKLVQDKEGEVRSIACKNLDKLGDVLGRDDNFDKVLYAIVPIKNDPLAYVRSSLAESVLYLPPIIGTKKTNEFILPIFQELITDQEHDIRMPLIRNLDKLNEVINVDSFVMGMLPSLIEISNNTNWRIRTQIAEAIVVLARVSKKTFLDSILVICLNWLTDPVYSIRETACKIMIKLYNIFKGEEFEKKLIGKLNLMVKSESYLIRITVLKVIKEFLSNESDLEFFEKKLFPFLGKLTKDKIANVRTNCSIILKNLLKISKNSDIIKNTKSYINELKKDKDIEVIYALSDN